MIAALPFPNIGPNIFTISLFGAEFILRWYALAYIVGLLVGWRIMVALMRRPNLWPGGTAPMRPEQVEDLLTAVILGVVIGGRLGYVLIYEPAQYLSRPLDILKVWEGGMSFHGGFIGVVIAGLWFCRRHGIPIAQTADAFSLAVPPGLFLGRIANFINGELWGRVANPDLPWTMVFPQAMDEALPRHPSQLYQALGEGLLLFIILWVYARKERPRGAISAVFLIGYGVFRFVAEYFREPDHGIFGISTVVSMGQWLSLPMIVAGAILLAWATRRARV